MANTANYKCPACTGPLHFVGSSQKLECDFCGSSYTVDQMEEYYKKSVDESEKQSSKEKAQSEKNEDWGHGSEDFHTLNCSTCGAELITDHNTVATNCPYCGNPTIIPGQFTGGRKPDYVIPFKLNKQQAVDAMKKYYDNKKLLPSVFRQENHVEEVKGIYIPFWLFDAETNADINYKGTRVFTRTSGNYRVVRTDHYRMRRKGKVLFERIPVDASEKMDNAMMDSIEPFDYSELKEFKTSYLPGFLAEAFDDSEENCLSRLEKRATNSVREILKGDLSLYATTITTDENISVKNTRTSYALLPAWVLSTKWKDKNYIFAMNGQTGKFVGNLPCDKLKFLAHFGLTFLITGVITGLLAYLIF